MKNVLANFSCLFHIIHFYTNISLLKVVMKVQTVLRKMIQMKTKFMVSYPATLHGKANLHHCSLLYFKDVCAVGANHKI